jgi:hypothetical protein
MNVLMHTPCFVGKGPSQGQGREEEDKKDEPANVHTPEQEQQLGKQLDWHRKQPKQLKQARHLKLKHSQQNLKNSHKKKVR